jgi:hypothetical protein
LKTFWYISLFSAGLVLGASAYGRPGFDEGARKNAAPKSRKSSQQAQEKLTGCVDQQNGKYVLLDESMLKVANLDTKVASTDDYFAKHVGHKVAVRGTKSSGTEAVFTVTSIEDIAAECAPAQGRNQQ